MKAVYYDEPRRWRLAELPDPEPGPHDVRLRVRAAGMCGTDVHLHEGEFGHVYPLVPGHEIVGEIDKVGDEVTDRQPGQLIALDNMIACGLCDMCRRARPAHCRSLRAMGVFEAGGFAEYLIAPAGKCHPVDDLGADVAVLTEPTACAMHGLDILDPTPGSDVLIMGAGPTGLLLTQLLLHTGAARVTVAAPTPFKLALAAGYGAQPVPIERGATVETLATLHQIAPDGFDVVVDATGSTDILALCPPLTAVGGTVLVYGVTAEDAKWPISPYDVFRREITIKGSFSQAYSFDRALRVLRSGRLDTAGIVTHHFGLNEYEAALDAVRNDPSCLKAVLRP
ncbi:MAG TPA: zinc-dependent alcohol dehydrogenase family protein [Micromonosporaceae bacterium]|nr:zinc-dependent alcohol dehydrogenase family protein [Micromonosporaceae bacterium]